MVDEVDGEPECFRDIPYSDLPIDTVDWLYRADHIRERTLRYGDSEINLEPEWATEAALDENRLVGPSSSVGSITVVGWSGSAPGRTHGARGRVLKVWLVPKGSLEESGDWWGATACTGNDQDRRNYFRGE